MVKTAYNDALFNYAPYAMMAYGNTLAAPSSFTHDDGGTPLPAKEITKQRIRHLLKGIVYTGSGYAATRAIFRKDFDPEESEFHTPGLWNSLKRETVELAHHQGVPRFLLPKVKAASLENPMDSAEYLIKFALLGTALNPLGHVATRAMSEEGDPNAFQTGDKGALSGLGRSVTHGLAGAGIGGLVGAAGNAIDYSMTRHGRLSPAALTIGAIRGSLFGVPAGLVAGGVHGVYTGARDNAYKKPAKEKKQKESA